MFAYPPPVQEDNLFGHQTSLMNANDEGVALVMQAPHTLAGSVTITGVYAGITLVSGVSAGESCNLEMSVQTVGSGLPTGTEFTTGSTGSDSIDNTDKVSDKWYGADLGTAAAVDPGDIFALVCQMKNLSGTINVSAALPNGHLGLGFPYGCQHTGLWGKLASGRMASMAAKLSDGTLLYCPVSYMHGNNISTHVINNTDTGDHVGTRLQMPYDCKVAGGFIQSFNNGGNDWSAELWSGDSVVGSTGTIAGSLVGGSGSDMYNFFFTQGEVELTANTTYRLIITPESISDVTAYTILMGAQGELPVLPKAMLWGGAEWYETASTNSAPTAASDFADDTSRKFPMGLWVTQVNDTAGGAGGDVILPARKHFYFPQTVQVRKSKPVLNVTQNITNNIVMKPRPYFPVTHSYQRRHVPFIYSVTSNTTNLVKRPRPYMVNQTTIRRTTKTIVTQAGDVVNAIISRPIRIM